MTVMRGVAGRRNGRLYTFIRRHPALLLVVLSLGIAEYLNASSPLSALVFNPAYFVFQTVANLALYGPGVLLIREALVRWHKGWSTSIALGAAYGVLEEGIALATFFNPGSSSRLLGGYGWWHGVNWIWAPAITTYHAVYSVTLPILLLDLAVPETKGKPLLGGRSTSGLALLLLAGVRLLILASAHGEHFVLGVQKLLASAAAVTALILIGYLAPRKFFAPRTELPRKTPLAMFPVGILGSLFFPMMLAGKALHLPGYLTLTAMAGLEAIFLLLLIRWIGASQNHRHLVALTAGLLLPQTVAGIVNTMPFLAVLPIDLIFGFFLVRLWRDIPDSPPISA